MEGGGGGGGMDGKLRGTKESIGRREEGGEGELVVE